MSSRPKPIRIIMSLFDFVAESGRIYFIGLLSVTFFLPLIIYILRYFDKKNLQSMVDKVSTGDLLAFYGAIIGGLLTLFGVRLTLAKQEKIKELETTPVKIVKMDALVHELYLCKDALSNNNIEYLKNSIKTILELGAFADARLYMLISDYTFKYRVLLRQMEINDLNSSKNNGEITQESLIDESSILIGMILEFRMEMFRKLMKRMIDTEEFKSVDVDEFFDRYKMKD